MAVPAALVPMWLARKLLPFDPAATTIPLPLKRLIAKARIVLPPLPDCSTSPVAAPAPAPFSSMSGNPA